VAGATTPGRAQAQQYHLCEQPTWKRDRHDQQNRPRRRGHRSRRGACHAAVGASAEPQTAPQPRRPHRAAEQGAPARLRTAL